MRDPAYPGQTKSGDSGGNLPTVLRAICADPERGEALAEWTRELTPMDVRGFDFPVDPTTGRVHLVIREAHDRRVSAYAASDGTKAVEIRRTQGLGRLHASGWMEDAIAFSEDLPAAEAGAE